MIIPYAHEDHRGRRWPLVTLALIVVNVACLVAFQASTRSAFVELDAHAEELVAFRDSHPAIDDSCAKLTRLVTRRPRPRADAIVAAPSANVAADQYAYDRLCRRLQNEVEDTPTFTWGYVPAKNNVAGLFTYQFVHGGWVHLLSNLWFLWLCGCNIEDRWGRAVYLPFYLSAGVAAALLEKLLAPGSMTPIIGASGSIAGAMGAFLVLFARTRIKFAYAFFFVRWGTFAAPAAVMLPLWLASEIFWGAVGGSGVAHWAHVGGFVYGALFAFVLRQTGLDAKLDSSIDETITKAQDPRILRAGELIDAGRAGEAIAILMTVARERPRSIDAQLELLRAAKGAKSADLERQAYAKLIELYFDTGAPDTASDLFSEMAALRLHMDLTRGWALRVAENCTTRALFQRADEAYAAACHEGLVDVTAVRATLAHARVLLRLGRHADAKLLLREARESPFAGAAITSAVDEELAKLA